MSHQYYFFVDPQDISQQQALLRDDEHHHLSRVLRQKPGDTILLIDGLGTLYTGTITEIGKRESRILIESQVRDFGEERFRLTLAQAVPQPARFEWLLEKGTEIGVAAFWAMRSQLSATKSQKGNIERWQRITKSALKQCGRSGLPEIQPVRSFEKILAEAASFDCCWIAHAPVPQGAKIWTFQPRSTATEPMDGILFVGPESGFSDQETELAFQHDFHFLDLGVRRLRSETAGLVAATLLLQQFSGTASPQ